MSHPEVESTIWSMCGKRKMVLWACLVQASIINAQSPFPSLLFNKNRIGKSVGVEYLSDESGYQEFGDFFAYGPAPLILKTAQALLGGL